MKMLAVDYARCTGCRLCEIACSLHHDGIANPAAARLAIVRWDEEGLHVPTVCLQCEEARCEQVCQPRAITRNSRTGALTVDNALCIGCRLCVIGCPYGAMSVHPSGRPVLKCDLCGGEPRCVVFCETGALQYIESQAVAFGKRTALACALVRSA